MLILKYAFQQDNSNERPKNRKTLKLAINKLLEDTLYLWFTQRSLSEPKSGPLLCGKALDFNKQLNGPPNLKASSEWLNNFKQRHGIRQLDVQGEMLSGDSAAAELFIKITIDQQLARDDVYNAAKRA